MVLKSTILFCNFHYALNISYFLTEIGFGTVYKAKLDNKYMIAIKELKTDNNNNSNQDKDNLYKEPNYDIKFDEFQREVQIMR